VEAATQGHQGREEFLVTRPFSHLIELLIVDEANRLKDAGLELMRDFADRGEFGLVLLGIPGLEKRLMRAPQLYSRVGFAHEMEPLSDEETRDFLEKRWSHRVKTYSDDFTDKETVATILRITRGNIRLIERLMLQVGACPDGKPDAGCHQRCRRDRTAESDHRTRLISALLMRCLKTVRFLRQADT
jgi:DNA transposition AAA+ family ATPase